jgi:PadR family transcriptional regulator PadR
MRFQLVKTRVPAQPVDSGPPDLIPKQVIRTAKRRSERCTANAGLAGLFHLTHKQRWIYSIWMPNKRQAKADVLQGTLDLMVLQTVETLGPLHGYEIATRLEQVSGGALQLNMGSLYPGLMRLEQRGLVRGKWAVTANNRRARFYELTAAGRRQLAAEQAEWDRMVFIMHTLLHGQG